MAASLQTILFYPLENLRIRIGLLKKLITLFITNYAQEISFPCLKLKKQARKKVLIYLNKYN